MSIIPTNPEARENFFETLKMYKQESIHNHIETLDDAFAVVNKMVSTASLDKENEKIIVTRCNRLVANIIRMNLPEHFVLEHNDDEWTLKIHKEVK